MIRLLTMKDGKVVMDRKANPRVTIGEVCEIAEHEVMDGYADYARVTIDGEIYIEVEA